VQIDALANDPLVRSARAVLSSGPAAARAAVVTHLETAPPLALRVTANPDPVGLGDIITYSVTVTNTGGSDSAGLVVDLRVPEGLYSTSGCQAVSDGGTLPAACASGRDVEWTITSLPAGSSRTLQFVGLVTVAGLADGDLIHATARVRDVAGAAARADVSTVVTDNPALALTLDESADPVRPDGTLAYVLRFGNRSASPLVGTTLSLVLPPGVTVVDDGNATVTDNTAVWDLTTLGAGDAGERRLTVQIDTLTDEPLVRTAHAEITSGTNAARAAVVTQVETAPPLALVMTATPDPVELGEIITYSLTVTNTGDTDADGVTVDLRVPAGMYSTSGCQAVSDGGTLPAACATGRDIEWDIPTVAAGTSRTVQFVGVVTVAGLPDGHLIHGDARARDVNGAAARAEVTTTVGNNPPLALTLDDIPDPIAIGDTIDYVLRYGNRSASPLTSSSLVLSLPPGVSVVDDGGATIVGDDAIFDLSTLNAGVAGTHHVTVEVTDLGAAEPLVRAARGVVQSGAEAARAEAVTQVEAVSPLSLTLTATPDPVALGGLITYTLTVANDGGSDAVGVELRMPVPSGLYSTSGCNSVSDGGVLPAGCAAGRDIVWDLGTIATGANRAVQFVGKVTVAGLPDGTLIHATARVRDVVGSAARAGVTTAVN
jgi:uncharacterized repeat protein (TIGR01451 family)